MADPPSAELVLAGLVLLLVVAIVVARPLLTPARDDDDEGVAEEARAPLEAAKEAKYREIRDAELDYRMGKLSEADYRATDRELRAQAIGILRRIDAIDGRDPAAEEDASSGGRLDDRPPGGR